MSLLEKMRAERRANAANAEARLGRFVGQSSDATTQNNAELSHNDNHGRHIATTSENWKLSQKVNNCGPPATATENQKLSHSGHNGAGPEVTTHANSLPQNLQSQDGKRLVRLLDQYRRGAWMLPAIEQAVELTIALGVSLRTAQRHIKRGTLPSKERKLGADGKHHPLRNAGRARSKCERELMFARRALERAAHAAATDGIQERERELLKQIQMMVAEMQTDRKPLRAEANTAPGNEVSSLRSK